jgi:hypothetical protein
MENFTPKPQPKQESVPQSGIEKIQAFLAEKLEAMSPLFDNLQSIFEKAGEKMDNVTLSPELASRAKIVLPVFMGLLTVMGNVEDASAQSQGQWVQVNGSWHFVSSAANTSGGTVQMTSEQWAAEQRRQKDIKTGQDLRTAGMYTNIGAGVATTIGMTSRDPKVQNAALITGSALNLTGTILTVVGNEKIRNASAGGNQQMVNHNPHLNNLPNGGFGY